MKTTTLFQAFFLMLLVTLSSCSNSDTVTEQERKLQAQIMAQKNCQPGSLPFTTIDDYFGCPTKYFLNINLNESYTIIRSQAEFNALVTYSGTCPINIDLTNYDLVIGKKQLTSGNESISYEYTTDDCLVKKLKVTFNQNEAMNAPNVTYHALIPKLSDTESLAVETVVN